MKISFVVPKYYYKNKLFDIDDQNLNRNNAVLFINKLKLTLESQGCEVATYDLLPIEDADVAVYIDMPKFKFKKNTKRKDILILFECEVVRPDNWKLERHSDFDRILTWNDDFVDNIKYFKSNFSFPITEMPICNKKKLITLVAANKKFPHKKELYSERLKAIKWFGEYAENDFDFYGFGWTRKIWGSSKLMQRLSYRFAHKILGDTHLPCYRGSVDNKYEVLQEYSFAICFENAKDISGYVTEKIFDCFVSGCVPVYYGAPNIDQIVDSKCYIDFRKFESYSNLYKFLSTMSADTYNAYLKNIQLFLKSESAHKFSCEYFANNSSRLILEA